MNSERNVCPSGCASRAWRISMVSSLIRANDRLQRGDERQHDLAVGLHLELAGAPLRAGSQPREQLPGGFAARVAVALEKRLQPLLAQTTGIERGGIAAQKRQRDLRVHLTRTRCRHRARSNQAGRAAGWPGRRACARGSPAPASSRAAPWSGHCRAQAPGSGGCRCALARPARSCQSRLTCRRRRYSAGASP